MRSLRVSGPDDRALSWMLGELPHCARKHVPGWRAIANELGVSERSVRRCGKYPLASQSLTRCLSAAD
jgi:hypothetical protein